ncbi:MAG: glycosyltransferase family 2 protein [Bryobacterales bacterium]|nr:glycosyltransferase family 2 protein [Bryobacterales bacterium]
MPRISVGMPVRNGENFVRIALDSVLSQTFRDFELIISDNDSQDQTAAICRAYADRDSRVRYYRQDTVLPPAANHNFVLRQAKGELFKWACHDDVCDPEFLSKCVGVLDADPGAVLAYPGSIIIDDSGNELRKYSYPLRTNENAPAVRFGSLLRADHRRFTAFEIYGLMRMQALRQIREMGNYVTADRVVLVRMALLGRFAEVPHVLFFSREHGNRSVRTLPGSIAAGRVWLRRVIGVGPLPPLEWWDSSKAGCVNFPEWRLIREYLQVIREAPVRLGVKVQCLAEVARWVVGDIPKLGRDVIIAAEQLLTPSRGIRSSPTKNFSPGVSGNAKSTPNR